MPLATAMTLGIIIQMARAAATPLARPEHAPDSVPAACETVRELAGRVLRLDTRLDPDIDVTNEFAARGSQARRGCRVSGHADDDRIAAPVETLVEAMQAHGWRALLEYQADGPDGSLMGLILGPTLCVVRGAWDGGDDSDTTYVPVPGYDLDVSCFRHTPADLRPR